MWPQHTDKETQENHTKTDLLPHDMFQGVWGRRVGWTFISIFVNLWPPLLFIFTASGPICPCAASHNLIGASKDAANHFVTGIGSCTVPACYAEQFFFEPTELQTVEPLGQRLPQIKVLASWPEVVGSSPCGHCVISWNVPLWLTKRKAQSARQPLITVRGKLLWQFWLTSVDYRLHPVQRVHDNSSSDKAYPPVVTGLMRQSLAWGWEPNGTTGCPNALATKCNGLW